MILQKEFANRLIATPGNEDYGWLSVLSYKNSKVELFDTVPKTNFYPPPQVDSVIVSLKSLSKKPFVVNNETFFVQMLKWLFTQRNKKVGNALLPFLKSCLKLSKGEAKKLGSDLPFQERRSRELKPEDFGVLANDICG